MKFWGTSKQSAYIGWFVTFIGGAGIGAGSAIIFVTRVFATIISTLNPNLAINPEAYANLQLVGAFLIFLGLLGCILGIVAIHNSQTSMTSISVEKKFCQYCGTEIKSDAIFCEKCGRKITI